MRSDDVEEMGGALSRARRAQRSADIDLRPIGSSQEAQHVQDFAVDSLRQSLRGYTLAATSAVTARLLNCFDPVIGKLFSEDVLDSGARVRIPRMPGETNGLDLARTVEKVWPGIVVMVTSARLSPPPEVPEN